jgi:acyl dehydratase
VSTAVAADVFARGFHELAPGDRFSTPETVVDEGDILDFADLTGDAHPQHVDPEWAAGSRVGDAVFKQPVKIGDALHVEGDIVRTRELDPEHGLVEARIRIVNQHGRLAVRASLELVWRA